MKNKINEILELIKLNKFNDAKIIGDSIKRDLEKNYEFLNIYGYILFRLENNEEAIKLYKKIIKIKPDYAFSFNNLANIYSKLNKLEDAIKYFNQALELKSDYFEASYGLSDVYFKMQDYDNALSYINKSIKLKPGYLPPVKSKLNLLKVMEKKEDILKFLNDMIIKFPDDAYFYSEKGLVLSDLGKQREAINSYKSAYLIEPDYPYVLGNIVFDKLINCEWDKIENYYDEILFKTKNDKEVADPLTVSYIFDSLELQKKSAEIWTNFKYLGTHKKNQLSKLKKKEKINIGYYSADFRNHPVGHLISRTIELHDKLRFNVHGFYFGKRHKKEDPYHSRLKKAFHEYHNVADKSDEEIVNFSRDLEIDIAIDLMGHTGGFENRLNIFLNECAPVQINFLGYPGTLGTDKIHYIIADRNLIQEDEKKFYSEKIIYLPNSYQPSEKERSISDKKFTKEQFNLPNDKFIFCCFNSNQKILKMVFNLWVEILKKTPKSILWLLSKNEKFINNLKNEFEKNKINPERIIFSEPMPVKEHLVRINFADLFLDTFPYNAHTTCSDSIWAGIPVLTKIGKTFHSRVASSLLKTSGLEELITSSDEEYVSKAIQIANDEKYFKYLKNKLNTFRDLNPLFDSKLYTRNLEQAYEIVFQNHFHKKDLDDVYL